MPIDFDQIVDRTSSSSVKYDARKAYFGTEDVIPLWVADMDFNTPYFITESLRKRTDHEIYGYSFRPPEYSIAGPSSL